MDGDGKADLAVGNAYVGGGGDTISILLGKGDGTVKPYIPVPVPGDGDDSLVAADLNDDGKLDRFVASYYNSSGGYQPCLGTGMALLRLPCRTPRRRLELSRMPSP